MKRINNKSFLVPAALFAVAIVPGLTGCGGGHTNGDNIAHTQFADPAVYEYQDNFVGGVGLSTAPSGLGSGYGTGSLTQPSASDALYATFGSSATGTILAGAGGTIATGLPAPGVYPAGTPGESSLLFRSTVVNGQSANRNVPAITSVSLAVPGGSTLPETFAYNIDTTPQPTGPFIDSEYVTPLSLSFADASGVYPLVSTVTDASGSSSTTTFQIVVLESTDSAIGVTSTTPPVFTGGVPVLTYGPDANNTYVYIAPPGTYTVTTSAGTSASFTTTAGTFTVPTVPAAAAGIKVHK